MSFGRGWDGSVLTMTSGRLGFSEGKRTGSYAVMDTDPVLYSNNYE